MGVKKPEIFVTADPALLLDPAPADKIESFLLSQGMKENQKYAMFVLRPWQGVDEKLSDFAAEAERLYRNHDIVPVFFALEPGRDLAISRKVAEMVRCPSHVIAAPHDGHLIVGMMGKMEMVISMRLHALIFAAGLGIPLVGIVYDPKVSGFLDYLKQDRYVLLENLTSERLRDMAEEALGAGNCAYSAAELRRLAEENETAARKLLEEV